MCVLVPLQTVGGNYCLQSEELFCNLSLSLELDTQLSLQGIHKQAIGVYSGAPSI